MKKVSQSQGAGKENVRKLSREKCAFAVILSDYGKRKLRHVEQIITDGYKIRRASVENNLPLFTDLHLARAFVRALCGLKMKDLKIKAYNEYEF